MSSPADSRNYHFDDFTRANYRKLLALAKQKYTFRSYTGFDQSERFVLWRHDVDFSVHAALQLARLEAEADVRATYFVHLHSEFYNLLEGPVSERLREILRLGHFLGLHFDAAYYGDKGASELEMHLSWEKELLETLFDVPVEVFSFHNPDAHTLALEDWTYAGMVNTYSQYFKREVGYCSDSNGFWRHRRLEDVLAAAAEPRLQVLTHPGWWQDSIMSPRERVQRCIEGRAQRTIARYDAVLKEFERENVGAAASKPPELSR